MTTLFAVLSLAVATAQGAGKFEIRGPSWFDERAVLYAAFDRPAPAPLLDRAIGIEALNAPPRLPAAGLVGAALDARSAPLKLRSEAFGVHRPWTLSFWWSLPADLPVDGAFGMFGLTGKGYVAAFVRGKGEWCALRRPAGILQVYYFAGIQNVNGIYDDDLAAHLELRKGAWHHCAAVFRMGSVVELFTDGKRVASITATGRSFAPSDATHMLELGGGVLLDEVAVLDRAVSARDLADYVAGMRRIAEYAP